MKALGAALLLCGTALLCRALLASRRHERETLRALAAALENLEREIRVSLTPMPRLLAQHGQGANAESFFAAVLALREAQPERSLPDCWRVAAQQLPLSPQEQESAARPADALGGEEENLLCALRTSAQELRAALALREAESARERRLIPALCFSLSLLITVLLI